MNGRPSFSGRVVAAVTMNVHVLVTDQAGTASRPVRVQRGQALLVEGVDHVADGVLIGGDQPGDRRYRCPGRRRHDDHRPADPDRPMLTAAHDLLQPLPLLIGQPSRPDRFCHRHSNARFSCKNRVWTQADDTSVSSTRRTFLEQRASHGCGGVVCSAARHRCVCRSHCRSRRFGFLGQRQGAGDPARGPADHAGRSGMSRGAPAAFLAMACGRVVRVASAGGVHCARGAASLLRPAGGSSP